MKKGKRSYVQKARKESQEQTRQRIVEALVKLHQAVGPKNTTISAVAEEAGVQRLTVYRHFPDEASMLRACSSHYVSDHPPPQPTAWEDEADPRLRVRAGLRAVYGYYRETEPMLSKIYRDVSEVEPLAAIMSGFDGYFNTIADQLVSGLAGRKPNKTACSAARHLLRFSTWQSLTAEGLSDAAAADAGVTWLQALLEQRT